MCGIAASVGLPGRVEGIVDALKHRGPDQHGSVRSGPFALGAARLRVNGDARGDQPLGRDARVTLVANAEVFNHAELGEAGRDAAEGDLAPLARALESDFPGALRRVRGPYAVAALHRGLRMLLLARDPVGVRPLHVARTEAGIVAASEIGPLLACLDRPPSVDRAALAHLIAFQFLPPGRTLIEQVASLRPGEVRLYDEAGSIVASEGIRFGCAAEGDLGTALREAAALQGVRDGRAAVFLSGGLDSSAVAGLLSAAGHPPDLAVTGFFPDAGEAFDERPHARAVAASLGIPLAEAPIEAAAALTALPALVRALGGPLAGPGGMAQFVLARCAAREGVRVVYSGEGGDELFGGYERHRLLQQIEAGQRPVGLPGYAPLAEALARAQDPLAAAVFRGAEMLPLLHDEARHEVADVAFHALPPPGPDRADRALAFEIERFLPGLLAVDDVTLAAFGIEGRVPLLDPVVAASASAIPLFRKSPPGAPRRTFRDAVGGALPLPAARRRDKMGFPMPLDAWLASPPWRDFALDRIRPGSLERFGFDGARVHDAFERKSISARGRWFLLGLDIFDEMLAEAR